MSLETHLELFSVELGHKDFTSNELPTISSFLDDSALESLTNHFSEISAADTEECFTYMRNPDTDVFSQSSPIPVAVDTQTQFDFEDFNVFQNTSKHELTSSPGSDFDELNLDDLLFGETSSSGEDDGSLPPSPTSPGGFPMESWNEPHTIISRRSERFSFKEWTFHDHFRPDGTCSCLDSKKKGKCVTLRSKRKRTNKLWHFLLELLCSPEYSECIRWLDVTSGVFRIEQSQVVARLWGLRKKKDKMTYEHMSRGLRHYYAAGILRRHPDKRLTYQFGPNAENWKQFAGIQNA